MKLQQVTPLSCEKLEEMGLSWHTNSDNKAYISDKLVQISEAEAEQFYEVCNELYDRFVEAGEYVIENDLLHELKIPFNLHEIVKMSWENDVHWHLYGRFDLAGGIDGLPIKLLEFNADTPTALFETLIVQYELLRANNLDTDAQFNHGYDAIVDNFKRLVTLSEDVSGFSELYDGWKILFASVKDAEEEVTTRLLMQCAIDAGFECEFAYVEDVEFSDEGVFLGDNNYEFCFMLLPWEIIAIEESELAHLLTKIVANQRAIILNPAYTLMFQSKYMLEILHRLNPEHPNILKVSKSPLEGIKCVKKPCFGREGANVSIIESDGKISCENGGEYDNDYIYQEYAQMAQDDEGNRYQAGVFFAYEACALGFRNAKNIIDNYAQFSAHIIK